MVNKDNNDKEPQDDGQIRVEEPPNDEPEEIDGQELQAQLQELQNEVLKLRNSNKENGSEMSRALAITRAIVPFDPKKQTLEEWRAKFEARARLLRLQFKELLEFMGLCLTDKAWDTYNRRLMHNPQEPPERTYYGIVTELTKQYSESPKHAFSTLCKMRYKKDIFRHSTEIYRLTKLAFPTMAADARDQICVHVFWKSLPQSKLVEGYFNTFAKMEKQTLSEAVTLVGDSLDSPDDEGEKTDEEIDDDKKTEVTAVAYWPYPNRGKGKGKGKGWYHSYDYGKRYSSKKGYGYSKGKAKGGKGKGKYKRPAPEDDDDDDQQAKRMKVVMPQKWLDECAIGHPSKNIIVGDSQELVVAVLDTGSSKTLMSKKVAEMMKTAHKHPVENDDIIVGIAGKVDILYYIDVVVNHHVELQCPVVNTEDGIIKMNGVEVDILFGMDYCNQFELVNYINEKACLRQSNDTCISSTQNTTTKDQQKESKSGKKGTKDATIKASDFEANRRNGKWSIAWKWISKPKEKHIRVPFYSGQIESLSTQQKELFKKEIELWIEKGYIKPCTEEYAKATYTIMPQIQMHKKSTPVRPVLNLKPLNSEIKSLPNEQSDPLACGNTLRRWRCKYGPGTLLIDIKKAYLQVSVEEEFRPYLCIRIPFLDHEYWTMDSMPFGLNIAPKCLTEIIAFCLKEDNIQDLVEFYVDDGAVEEKNYPIVKKCLQKNDFTLKEPEKLYQARVLGIQMRNDKSGYWQRKGSTPQLQYASSRNARQRRAKFFQTRPSFVSIPSKSNSTYSITHKSKTGSRDSNKKFFSYFCAGRRDVLTRTAGYCAVVRAN